MNNQTILIKIKQRVNKLASNDYDNIENWQVLEAFNKGVVAWCRRNLHGLNVKQTGDEQSKARIDDLQVILVDTPVNFVKRDGYYDTTLPADYFEWKRISAKATNSCCDKPRPIVITLAEEANVDEINRDFLKKPSFEWGETYCTMKNNVLKVHTNNEFDVTEGILFYYKQPRHIEIAGTVNPYTGVTSVANVECEFKDDLVELFVDEAAKIIAGDIESFNQQQTATQQVEGNN
jgi:hypothetical protein